MQQVISHRDIITWSVLHGSVIMYAVLHGGCNMDFSKWRAEILHEIDYKMYLVFHTYFVFFGKKNSSEIHIFVRSVFVINVSLFSFIVCFCQNGLLRKHGKCSLCNEWWHSFINQRLNHLVLLYKKYNCL